MRRASGRRYPHFLIFALHVHGVWFGSQAMAGAIGHVVGHPAVWVGVAGLSLLYRFGYLLLALRAVYGGTWLRALRDVTIVMALYWMALTLTGLAITLPAVFLNRAP